MKIKVTDHGTVVGFTPLDKEAVKFLRNVGASPYQFMGDSLYIDHRVAQDFIAQSADDGVEYSR